MSKFNSVIKNCLNCGKEFYVSPSRIKDKRGKYCSKKCKYAGKSIIKECSFCGKNIRFGFHKIRKTTIIIALRNVQIGD